MCNPYNQCNMIEGYSDFDYSKDIINSMHNAPHLDENLQITDNTFSLSEKYIMSILPICIIVLVLAFIVWIALLIASIGILNTKYSYLHNDRCLQSGRALFFALLVVFILISFASLYKSIIGLEMFRDNSDLLVQEFKSLNLLIIELLRIEEYTRSTLYGVCSSAISSTLLSKYKIFADDLISKTRKFQVRIENITLEKFIESSNIAQTIYSIVLYSVLSFELLLVIILVTTTYSIPDQSFQIIYKISFILLISVELVLILLVSLLLFIVIVTADFCADPVESILSFLEPPKENSTTLDSYSITKYYLTCPTKSESYTSSSILGSFDKSRSKIAVLQAFTAANAKYIALVDPDAELCMNQLDESLTNASITLSGIESQLACSKINGIVQAGVLDGFCSQFYVGIFFSWVFQLILLVVAYSLTIFLVIMLSKSIQVKTSPTPIPSPQVSPGGELRINRSDLQSPMSPSSMEMTSISKTK